MMSRVIQAQPTRSQLRLWVVRALKLFVLLPTLIAAISLLAWMTGRVVSDRYYWSQWLLWIPSVMAIAAALLGLTFTLIWPRKRAMLLGWSACLVGLLVYVGFIEYRMFAAEPEKTDGLRIVHWNATYRGRRHDEYIDPIIAADGDITIISDGGAMPYQSRIWVWNEGSPVSARPFAIATKLPILRQRYLANEDDIVVVMVEIDTTERIGRPLVVYCVDMPSDLRLERAELARRARRMMDNAAAPPPDVVVGDFNITRGAASLRMMFPEMTHAYEHAGRGFAATFHRGKDGWLVYHIDHILLSDTLAATRYDIIDPGIGRHNMQAVTIRQR